MFIYLFNQFLFILVNLELIILIKVCSIYSFIYIIYLNLIFIAVFHTFSIDPLALFENPSFIDWIVELYDIIVMYSQDGSEEPTGPLLQKTPIILAKPPGERVCVSFMFILHKQTIQVNVLFLLWVVLYLVLRHNIVFIWF